MAPTIPLEGCYNTSRGEISGCSCDSTCLACGYTDVPPPTGRLDCITCANGGDVWPYYPDNTGACLELNATGCFDSTGLQINDCTCHSSCEACGFYYDPSAADDCWTCADGGSVTPVYSDGTGTCSTSSSSKKSSDGLATGVIAGIAVGAGVVFIGAAAAIGYVFFSKSSATVVQSSTELPGR